MVNIVTGKINSGKTTKMMDIYQEHHLGDGFVSLKYMKQDQVLRYDLLRLKTNETFPFVLRDYILPSGWNECCKIGPYSFNADTLTYVETMFEEMIAQKVSPLFLDEIGPLELDGKCFHVCMQKLIDSGLDIYVSVRESDVTNIIKKYKIKEVNLIQI